ncbi:hypothetical protein [Actinoplanes aureus]|uniref:Phosphodiesterase n=1 Tax=Actinoplanes aureus TaxID=2792083 RepID=A0A931C6C3_9ACTN|nr:hypothetical protein [Actinoplanes aureus]MBG0562187.1 hypothetical protein [Actinoplanes aureus]
MRLIASAVLLALGVRLVRSRHRRALHPAGRSFTGELEVWGLSPGTGSALLDRPGRRAVTVRISKGAGTRRDRPDVLGLAIRADGTDLLLSTAGTGRLTRHFPMPRRAFGTHYGTITSYRTGDGRKIYLSAGPDRDAAPLGRTLDSVAAAASTGRAGLLLYAGPREFGRVRFGAALSPAADAALAFDPVRNRGADLYPIGVIQGVRAVAYRLSRQWRGA